MHIPFVSKAEALALLEDAQHADEARGEFLAEQGSSYFFGGMSSADATFMAGHDLAQQEQDFAMSEEGQLYFAKLEAARLYEGVADCLLGDWDIPEFVDGKVSYDHSPFSRVFDSPVYDGHDDIPF